MSSVQQNSGPCWNITEFTKMFCWCGNRKVSFWKVFKRKDKTGSEPSLASRNGQRSSVTASKRTLVSQENASSPPHKSQSSSDASNRSGSQSHLPLSDIPLPNAQSEDTPPSKTPSYLKLSCAVSGYNKYCTYNTPKAEVKQIRVIKRSESEDHSDSQEDSSDFSDCVVTQPSRRCHDQGIFDDVDRTIVNGRDSLQNGGVTIVTSCRTEKVQSKSSNKEKYVTKTTVKLQPSLVNGSPTRDSDSSSDFKLALQDEPPHPTTTTDDTTSNTLSPNKDGHYYLKVLDSETERIMAMSRPAEHDLQSENIPEEASGKLRAAVGKAHLLVNKKMNQFRGLCLHNINPGEDDTFPTTSQDLAGFWDMVHLQVEDVETNFEEIDKLRKRSWKEEKHSPVRSLSGGDVGTKTPSIKSSGSGVKSKSSRTKDVGKNTPSSTPRSLKAQEAAKVREEARKRLMAAKRAGRQRKASQSDKDGEIEIFVQ